MRVDNRFEETKIKMVMKLRGLTRDAAIKALHPNNSPDGKDVGDTNHSTARDEQLIMAKELFDDVDEDDGLMSAEEFFGL